MTIVIIVGAVFPLFMLAIVFAQASKHRKALRERDATISKLRTHNGSLARQMVDCVAPVLRAAELVTHVKVTEAGRRRFEAFVLPEACVATRHSPLETVSLEVTSRHFELQDWGLRCAVAAREPNQVIDEVVIASLICYGAKLFAKACERDQFRLNHPEHAGGGA